MALLRGTILNRTSDKPEHLPGIYLGIFKHNMYSYLLSVIVVWTRSTSQSVWCLATLSAVSFLLSSTTVYFLLLLFHSISAFPWSGFLPLLLLHKYVIVSDDRGFYSSDDETVEQVRYR